ncbi:MAG: hypothetical protein F4164_08225 [Gemmatimonadales bacterium]|nr:hypothetical protein [Gemmatimonadales bacterium]MYG49341.1 hypothetical protein [Gemmatimonadales bacterium]MYK00804.1 hypothetical protein [Candidatus Palauibacter ramosifaciens]
MQETHGDRSDLSCPQRRRNLPDGVLLEGLEDAARRIQPLRHLVAQVARHERTELREVDVVERGADLAGDL